MITPVAQNQFPYPTFPYRLEFGEKKNLTICWFQCEEHLDSYLKRYKLNKKKVKIDCLNQKPVKKRTRNGSKNKTNNRSNAS